MDCKKVTKVTFFCISKLRFIFLNFCLKYKNQNVILFFIIDNESLHRSKIFLIFDLKIESIHFIYELGTAYNMETVWNGAVS